MAQFIDGEKFEKVLKTIDTFIFDADGKSFQRMSFYFLAFQEFSGLGKMQSMGHHS
jgi:hypothetical protein